MSNKLKRCTPFSILALLFILLSGCAGSQNTSKTADVETSADSSPLITTDASASIDPSADSPPSTRKAEPLQIETSPSPEPASKMLSESEPSATTNLPVPPPTAPALHPIMLQPALDEALGFVEASQDFWQKGELENAIEALDQAYELILKVDTNGTAKELQQKEDLRFMISKRILEIYASRNIVVNGHHNAIQVVMNRFVQRQIKSFTQGREKAFFIAAYKRSGQYRPYIVKALREAGLPTELSWLPLIESGFKVNALSKARALGLWQFIPSTGYKFGLHRNRYIDERFDPYKSTQAAITYLKELHQIFGDWSTVLAAYNCGEGRVLRVIRSQNVNYLDNFWDLYQRLPRETAQYVPRFLATLHIIKNAHKFGLDKITPDVPLAFETHSVTRHVHLKDIALRLEIPLKTLKRLNPELRYKLLPKQTYPLRVPPGKGELLLSVLDQIPTYKPPQPKFAYHRIRPGETISTIARRYRTSIKRIARANHLGRRYQIIAGKTLKVPIANVKAYQSYKARKKSLKRPSIHIVKQGDSLWNIARHYGITTRRLQHQNHLASTKLKIGQRLIIRHKAATSSSPVVYKNYFVKNGDSPFRIAMQNKMPLEKLLRINALTPRSKIFPGQRLRIE